MCGLVVAIFPFRVLWCSCVLLLLDCGVVCCIIIADVVRICCVSSWLVVRCVLFVVRCRCALLTARGLLFVAVVS